MSQPCCLIGAAYLDIIWYAVEVHSAQHTFWKTVCYIDEAETVEIAQIVDGSARNRD